MVYSIPIEGTESEGCSKVYRNPRFPELQYPSDFGFPATGWEIFQRALALKPNSPCFGKRKVLSDGQLGQYVFKTYSEIDQLVKKIGSKILNFNVIEPVESGYDFVPPCRPIGIYSPNNIEWLITEQICNAYGLTLVPIYDTLGIESVLYIINETNFRILLIHSSCIKNFLNILSNNEKPLVLKVVIVIGEHDEEESLLKQFVNVVYWNDLMSEPSDPKDLLEYTPAGKDSLNTISFTSGSGGVPKGVMVTHENLASAVNAILNEVCNFECLSSDTLETYLSYLPLAHLYERICVNSLICNGGRIGLYSGNVRLLLNDAHELKPTVFASVPRVYQKIYDTVTNSLSQRSLVVRSLFNYAWESKLHYLNTSQTFKHGVWDKLLFKKFKNLMGGEVKWMITGSAPLNSKVLNSLKVFFGIPILNAYGLTECTACGFTQIAKENNATHIGGPLFNIQFKIASVPDLEYFINDKPNPRGELCLRGPVVTNGYFKNPELTKGSFKDDWFYTGDIVELLPDGAVRIIDRSKSIFKLAQGEYITPERLENMLVQSPYILQAFVTGKSDKYSPVAVFVLDEEQVEKWFKTTQKNNNEEEVKKLIASEIERISLLNELKGYEKIQSFHIEKEPFSTENSLLTPTLKLRRFYASKVYKDVVDSLY